jgi:drug/metabolite transporter (DMT)-like permease
VESSALGTTLIALAATLWATDSLFRAPVVHVLSPTFIVLFEHVIGTVALFGWTAATQREQLKRYSAKTWASLFLIGFGGSALATVFFTASFRYINPSVAILLQKLQPIAVILLAFIFLGEKPKKAFWGWALLALASALIVSFPDFDYRFLSGGIDFHSKGVIYALVAAALWAFSTVAGKSVSGILSPSVVTFWRYSFGLLTLAALFVFGGESIPIHSLQHGPTLRAILYISFFPGIAALLLYYSGLRRASALTATFTELLFPVAAVILNWIFLKAALNSVQILAGLVLLYSVSKISRTLR